jgi:hypothetical protein
MAKIANGCLKIKNYSNFYENVKKTQKTQKNKVKEIIA